MIIILTAAEAGRCHCYTFHGWSEPQPGQPGLLLASLSRQHNNTFPDKLQFQCGMPFNKCHVYSSQLVSQNWCNKTIFSGDTVSALFRCLSEGPRNERQHCLGTFLGTAMGHFVAQIEQQSAQSALSLVVIDCEILENEQKWPKATQCLVKQAAVVPARQIQDKIVLRPLS